jgi:hypothetical protein
MPDSFVIDREYQSSDALVAWGNRGCWEVRMRRTARILAPVIVVAAAVAAVIGRPALGRPVWSFLYAYRWWTPVVLAGVAMLALVRLFSSFLRHPSGWPWRQNVLAAADAIEHQLNVLPDGRNPAEVELRQRTAEAVLDHLGAAREAARLEERKRPGHQETPQPRKLAAFRHPFLDWWTGTSVEAAYLNLHEAEIALAQLLPEEEIQARIPETLARLQTMDVTDPRRRAAETELLLGKPGPRRRAAFRTAIRIGLELKDQQHDRIRGFRNIVLTATVGLMTLVVVFCLIGALKPDALPLCFGPPETTVSSGQLTPVQGPAGTACPSEEAPPTPGTQTRRLPAPGDVTLVALLGLMGGGLSAAVAIRHLQGSSTPYDIPVTLSLLKLPSGALSAVVGLLLIHGEFVPGLSQLDSQPQILAYAFLFGIAQQLVTRLVDRQAQDILSKVPSKEPTSAKPEPPLTEQQLQSQAQQPRGLLSRWTGRR